jgi:predicted permease
MLIIGHEIANMKVLDLIKDGWAYVVSLLRLLVIPTIVCVIFMFLPVDHEVLKVLVFLLAMPCGTLNVILSQQYGTNPQFASRATTQTMILFLITVPIMLVIINTLL